MYDQGAFIDKLFIYLNLKNPDGTAYSEHDLGAGLCFGLAICESAMAVTGKLDWWHALKKLICEWDGTPEKLSETYQITDSSKPETLEKLLERAINYTFMGQASKRTLGSTTTLYASQLDPNSYAKSFEILSQDRVKSVQSHSNFRISEPQKDSVASFLDANKKHFEKNICVVSSSNHTVSVRYVSNEDKWYYDDPNYRSLKPRVFSNTEDLSKALLSDLTGTTQATRAHLNDIKFFGMSLDNPDFNFDTGIKDEKYYCSSIIKSIQENKLETTESLIKDANNSSTDRNYGWEKYASAISDYNWVTVINLLIEKGQTKLLSDFFQMSQNNEDLREKVLEHYKNIFSKHFFYDLNTVRYFEKEFKIELVGDQKRNIINTIILFNILQDNTKNIEAIVTEIEPPLDQKELGHFLFKAAEKGKLNSVCYFLKKDVAEEDLLKCIEESVKLGFVEIYENLSNYYLPKKVSNTTIAKLFKLATENGNFHILEALIKQNTKKFITKELFMKAAEMGHDNIFRLFLKHRGEVFLSPNDLTKALEHFSKLDCPIMINYLLKIGANPNTGDAIANALRAKKINVLYNLLNTGNNAEVLSYFENLYDIDLENIIYYALYGKPDIFQVEYKTYTWMINGISAKSKGETYQKVYKDILLLMRSQRFPSFVNKQFNNPPNVKKFLHELTTSADLSENRLLYETLALLDQTIEVSFFSWSTQKSVEEARHTAFRTILGSFEKHGNISKIPKKEIEAIKTNFLKVHPDANKSISPPESKQPEQQKKGNWFGF